MYSQRSSHDHKKQKKLLKRLNERKKLLKRLNKSEKQLKRLNKSEKPLKRLNKSEKPQKQRQLLLQRERKNKKGVTLVNYRGTNHWVPDGIRKQKQENSGKRSSNKGKRKG